MNYSAITDDVRPAWWARLKFEYSGELIALVENVPGSPDKALIIGARKLSL